jgi:hypothetical protein
MAVNEFRIFQYQTLDNGRLSNVMRVLSGFSRGTGMASVESAFDVISAYVPF